MMKAHTPQELHHLWTQAFCAHDLDTLLSYYEPDGVLAPSPTERHEKHAGIRQALAAFLALKPTFQMTIAHLVESNGIAILFSPWQLTGTDPSGNPVHMSGTTADVVRQQPDGSWLMVLDNPFGGNPSLGQPPSNPV